MKQMPSQFFDDKEYQKLTDLKKDTGWTWKDLILSTIKEKEGEEKLKTKIQKG